ESSPAVVDGVVYVGSLDGNIYALTNQTLDHGELYVVIFAAVLVMVSTSTIVFIILRKRNNRS
ncbi:MAG: PQQ-binding-like beta-propeller repeat protein, partial [Ignavibacteria bacterium]